MPVVGCRVFEYRTASGKMRIMHDFLDCRAWVAENGL